MSEHERWVRLQDGPAEIGELYSGWDQSAASRLLAIALQSGKVPVRARCNGARSPQRIEELLPKGADPDALIAAVRSGELDIGWGDPWSADCFAVACVGIEFDRVALRQYVLANLLPNEPAAADDQAAYRTGKVGRPGSWYLCERVGRAIYGEAWIGRLSPHESSLVARHIRYRLRHRRGGPSAALVSQDLADALRDEVARAADRHDECEAQWRAAIAWLKDRGFDLSAPGGIDAAALTRELAKIGCLGSEPFDPATTASPKPAVLLAGIEPGPPSGIEQPIPEEATAPRRRGAYIPALETWLALRNVSGLRRIGAAALAKDFSAYCDNDRPELVPLLPQRTRVIEPVIERIIARRSHQAAQVAAAKKGH